MSEEPQVSAAPGAERTRMRETVATIDREIARLNESTSNDKPASDLLASWTDLVKQLALGPEPELRTCPSCGQMGMRAATLCGYCWKKLPPLGA